MLLYKRRKQKSRINIIYKREKIRREIWAILPCGFWALKNRSLRRKSGQTLELVVGLEPTTCALRMPLYDKNAGIFDRKRDKFMGYSHKIPHVLTLNRKRGKHHKHQINTTSMHIHETKWSRKIFLRLTVLWARQHHRTMQFSPVPA